MGGGCHSNHRSNADISLSAGRAGPPLSFLGSFLTGLKRQEDHVDSAVNLKWQQARSRVFIMRLISSGEGKSHSELLILLRLLQHLDVGRSAATWEQLMATLSDINYPRLERRHGHPHSTREGSRMSVDRFCDLLPCPLQAKSPPPSYLSPPGTS